MNLPLDTKELGIVVQELQAHPRYANASENFKKAFDICVKIEHLRTSMDELFDLDDLYNYEAAESATNYLLEGKSLAMKAKGARLAPQTEE